VPPKWSFLTNHALALFRIAQNPEIRIRELAVSIDVTERCAFGVVNDLIEGGYITKSKQGRRNRYEIQGDRSLIDLRGERKILGEIVTRYLGPTNEAIPPRP
jgi:predicted transcriptional regulator